MVLRYRSFLGHYFLFLYKKVLELRGLAPSQNDTSGVSVIFVIRRKMKVLVSATSSIIDLGTNFYILA